jgi:hypothetical protein
MTDVDKVRVLEITEKVSREKRAVPGQLIRLPQTDFEDFLDSMRDAWNEGRLKGFVCQVRMDYRDGEDGDGFVDSLPGYWFGFESCVEALGLVTVMKDRLLCYMRQANEE